MTLEKVNRFGLIEVSFNQTITVPKDWQTNINDTVLNIKIDPFNEENLPLKDLVWNIESFSSTRMTIQVNFKEPQYISDDIEGKDQILVKIINPTLFFSAETLSTVKNETQVESELPRQFAVER